MNEDFQRPFAAPPTIFLVSLILGIGIGTIWKWSVFAMPIQLAIGPLLILLGVWAIRSSIKEIEAADTTYDPYDVSTQLVTSGIYGYSRNPGYLGLAIIQLGIAVLFDNLWVIVTGAIAVLVTTVFVIRLEERKLGDAFGDPYFAYMKNVRRWI